MRFKTFLLIVFNILSLNNGLYAQSDSLLLGDYFSAPLNIPLVLSGTFGELRSNHFHGGIDIKTQGVEGKLVLAAAEGYVARIKVSPYGYGKVIYINHPNGYQTVYAHLQRFSESIEAYVRAEQYRQERFDVELYPDKNKLTVKKGEVIALSGNTGGSGGPHLHFEIRDEWGERALNPLSFGINIPDKISPDLYKLYHYQFDTTMHAVARNEITTYSKGGGKYSVPYDTIRVQNLFSFGVESTDKLDQAANKNGIYKLESFFNGEKIFEFNTSAIRFSETRYLNAHIDYDLKMEQGKMIHKAFKEQGNLLSAYPFYQNHGIVATQDTFGHYKLIISDFKGNQSILEFYVKIDTNVSQVKPKNNAGTLFGFNKEIQLKEDHFVLHIPANALYNNALLTFDVRKANANSYSKEIVFPHENIPLHKSASLSIKVDSLPKDPSKLVVVQKVKGKRSVLLGSLSKGYFTVNTKNLGSFVVTRDTQSPVIKPVNISNAANLRSTSRINIKVSDDLSGIKKYRAEIDGKWILMEYEPKSALLFHTFEGKATGSKHHFKLQIWDEVNNSSTFECNFIR